MFSHLPSLLSPPPQPPHLPPASTNFLRTLLTTPSNPPSLHLLRNLLHHPRYAQHARKALRAHDLPALLCLIAILPTPPPPPPISLNKALHQLPTLVRSKLSLLGAEDVALEEEEESWRQRVEEKEEKLRRLRCSATEAVGPLEEEESRLRQQLKEAEDGNRRKTLSVVWGWEAEREERRKEFGGRLEGVAWEEEEVAKRLSSTQSTLAESHRSLRTQRESLERNLRRAIRCYNAATGSFDSPFAELEERARRLEEERLALEELRKEVDDRFDDMVRIRRLKELLKNVERADGVRKNWAARRIQEAWRRYKIQKLRRKKLRGKKKKAAKT